MAKRRISYNAAKKAFDLLVAFGRQSFDEDVAPIASIQQCIGLAICSFSDDPVTISTTMLEHWNCHFEGACLEALRNHLYEREKTSVIIHLPYFSF